MHTGKGGGAYRQGDKTQKKKSILAIEATGCFQNSSMHPSGPFAAFAARRPGVRGLTLSDAYRHYYCILHPIGFGTRPAFRHPAAQPSRLASKQAEKKNYSPRPR